MKCSYCHLPADIVVKRERVAICRACSDIVAASFQANEPKCEFQDNPKTKLVMRHDDGTEQEIASLEVFVDGVGPVLHGHHFGWYADGKPNTVRLDIPNQVLFLALSMWFGAGIEGFKGKERR